MFAINCDFSKLWLSYMWTSQSIANYAMKTVLTWGVLFWNKSYLSNYVQVEEFDVLPYFPSQYSQLMSTGELIWFYFSGLQWIYWSYIPRIPNSRSAAQCWAAAHWESGRTSGAQAHKATFAQVRHLHIKLSPLPPATTASPQIQKGWGPLIYMQKSPRWKTILQAHFSPHLNFKVHKLK